MIAIVLFVLRLSIVLCGQVNTIVCRIAILRVHPLLQLLCHWMRLRVRLWSIETLGLRTSVAIHLPPMTDLHVLCRLCKTGLVQGQANNFRLLVLTDRLAIRVPLLLHLLSLTRFLDGRQLTLLPLQYLARLILVRFQATYALLRLLIVLHVRTSEGGL